MLRANIDLKSAFSLQRVQFVREYPDKGYILHSKKKKKGRPQLSFFLSEN